MIVPYKGAAGVVTDLMAGQIDLGFEATSLTLSHLHDGSMRALGVATPQRLPELADVPTMIESGVPDFIASSWAGILVPTGTPAAIIAKLNAETNVALKSEAMQARLKQFAAEAKPGTPQDFAASSRLSGRNGSRGEAVELEAGVVAARRAVTADRNTPGAPTRSPGRAGRSAFFPPARPRRA